MTFKQLLSRGVDFPTLGRQVRIDALNDIHRIYPDINFRDYGLLGNEITIADTVDRWEVVNRLIRQYIYDTY